MSILLVFDILRVQQGLQMNSQLPKSRLTRMPGIANLATTSHFQRNMPVVSAGLRGEIVSSSATTSFELPALDSHRAGLKGSSPTLTLASHALEVHGTCRPDTRRVTYQDTDAVTPTVSSKHPAWQHQQCHTIVYGLVIPVCRLHCGLQGSGYGPPTLVPKPKTHKSANIAVDARSLVQTMQGFPYDLRRSGVEASRLMGLSVDDEDLSQSQESSDQRQLTLSRSNAGRSRVRWADICSKQ